MKKYGFTLIELLAVIVVLAIIALIATPTVANVIEQSKKKTAIESGNNLIKTAELYMVTSKKKYGKINVLSGDLKYNGNKPEFGEVEINEEGRTRIYAYISGYCVTKEYYTDSVVANKVKSKEECKGFPEYLCKFVKKSNDGNVSTSLFDYGDEYTCELGDNEEKTFFIVESSVDTVSLIMDRNINSKGKGITSGNTVAWSSDGSNHKDEDASAQAITAKEYLKNSTKSWTKLTESQISLPTASQIATAAGTVFSNNKISNLPTWLYGNLNRYGAPSSYWTSTPLLSTDSNAWLVHALGTLSTNPVSTNKINGVRPVITISRSQLE